MKNIAVIFAGGTGQRMGAEIPKQFLKVYGKEIIIHTLELFELNESIDEIYVACIEEWIPFLNNLIKKYELDKVKKVFPGGKTGQDSIFISLSEIKKDNENAIVLIHDGVRPIVSDDTITNVVKSVKKYGNGITSTKCFETPIISSDGNIVNKMPDRSITYMAQAPQGFYLKDIYNVHLKERVVNPNYDGIIDSCGLMFKYDYNMHLIEGNRGNIKVTTPEDFCTLLGNLNARDYEQILDLRNKQDVKKLKKIDK